jgi:hypothetical protein
LKIEIDGPAMKTGMGGIQAHEKCVATGDVEGAVERVHVFQFSIFNFQFWTSPTNPEGQ